MFSLLRLPVFPFIVIISFRAVMPPPLFSLSKEFIESSTYLVNGQGRRKGRMKLHKNCKMDFKKEKWCSLSKKVNGADPLFVTLQYSLFFIKPNPV